MIPSGLGRRWRRYVHKVSCSACFGTGGGEGELRCPRCDRGDVWEVRPPPGWVLAPELDGAAPDGVPLALCPPRVGGTPAVPNAYRLALHHAMVYPFWRDRRVMDQGRLATREELQAGWVLVGRALGLLSPRRTGQLIDLAGEDRPVTALYAAWQALGL